MGARELTAIQAGMWAGMHSQQDYIDKKTNQKITGLRTVEKNLLRSHGFLEPIDQIFHEKWQQWQEMQKVAAADMNVKIDGTKTIRDLWIEETIKPAIKDAMRRAGHV